jgi:hypothetical protein
MHVKTVSTQIHQLAGRMRRGAGARRRHGENRDDQRCRDTEKTECVWAQDQASCNCRASVLRAQEGSSHEFHQTCCSWDGTRKVCGERLTAQKAQPHSKKLVQFEIAPISRNSKRGLEKIQQFIHYDLANCGVGVGRGTGNDNRLSLRILGPNSMPFVTDCFAETAPGRRRASKASAGSHCGIFPALVRLGNRPVRAYSPQPDLSCESDSQPRGCVART